MAHKRKHHSSRHGGMKISHDRRGHSMGEHRSMGMKSGRSSDYGETTKERMDLNEKMRIMHTNNGDMGMIREDFNRPCGIPYGALTRDLGNGAYFSMNAFRAGDLYEQVDKNMREDSAAIKSLTKPTNW
jgi:hypothetical protein